MVLPIRLTSLEGSDVTNVVIWVTQMYCAGTWKYHVGVMKIGQLVCPLLGDDLSTCRCGFWQTQIYNVTVAVNVA